MITNFYLNTKLVDTKNISTVPNKGDYVSISGQLFIVSVRELDLSEQYEQYNIYLKRCRCK